MTEKICINCKQFSLANFFCRKHIGYRKSKDTCKDFEAFDKKECNGDCKESGCKDTSKCNGVSCDNCSCNTKTSYDNWLYGLVDDYINIDD